MGRNCGAAVLDVRGSGDIPLLDVGWQKFCGQMLKLGKTPRAGASRSSWIHGPNRLCIEFILLPAVQRHRKFFVEDTYYADTADLDQRDLALAGLPIVCGGSGWPMCSGAERRKKGQLRFYLWRRFRRLSGQANKGSMREPGHGHADPADHSYSAMAVKNRRSIDCRNAEINQQAGMECCAIWPKNIGRTEKILFVCFAPFLFLGAEPDKRYKNLEHTYSKDEIIACPLLCRKSPGWIRRIC